MRHYVYKGVEYKSERELRNAIFEQERKAFAKCETVEEWAQHGVDIVVTEPTIEVLKAQKIALLDRAFMQWRNNGATLVSSLGFKADCDERAMIDVNGLVTVCGESQTVVFMDADNQPHELSLEQLKVLQTEIIQSGNLAYQTKWQLRTDIESAENKETLDAIKIGFAPVDFSVEA